MYVDVIGEVNIDIQNTMADCGEGVFYVYSGNGNATFDVADSQCTNNTNTNCEEGVFPVVGDGAAVFNAQNNLFEHNSATSYGAGRVYGNYGLTSALITDSQFIENHATDGSSGALSIYASEGYSTGGIYNSVFHRTDSN